MPTKEDYTGISVHYAPHETGWVSPVGDGTYVVDNIPQVAGLNIGDVVELCPGDPECCDRQNVNKVLRRTYPHKTLIQYAANSEGNFALNYAKLSSTIVDMGGKCEGFIEGYAGVAAKDMALLEATLHSLSFAAGVDAVDTTTVFTYGEADEDDAT